MQWARTFEDRSLRQTSSSSFSVRLLLVAAIVPVFMLLYGYFGDDYQFHLSSWIGIAQDWRSGVAFPSWLANANFGLGEPRFLFYPPLSMFVGAVLTMVLPLRLVPALYVFLVAIAAGLSMRKLAGWLVPEHQNAAALLYCTSYYLVANGVLRYASAEAVVAAFLPLLVLFYLRAMTDPRGMLHPLLSVMPPVMPPVMLPILLALAWLTNLPAALVIFYVLLFGTVLHAALQRTVSPLIQYLLAQGIAVGLSAWYLLPAMLAKGQVAPAGIQSKFPWHAYTLFQSPQNPLARTLTYPLWFWCLGGVALLAVWLVRQRSKATAASAPREQALWLVAVLGCLPLLFAVPQSGLLWNHLPQLQLVAFSWRFFPFLCLGLSLLAPVIVRKRLPRQIGAAVWILLMCLPMLERVAHRHAHGAPVPFEQSLREVRDPFGGFGEYLPAGVSTPPEADQFPGEMTSPGVQACSVKIESWAPQEKIFSSSGTRECSYILNLFYFPEWRATMDGALPLALVNSADHRIGMLLPPGDHKVRVVFVRSLAASLLGLFLTLLSAALLLFAAKHLSVRPDLQEAPADA